MILRPSRSGRTWHCESGCQVTPESSENSAKASWDSLPAVVEIPELQKLRRYVCKNGYEHHCAMNGSNSAAILAEAFETYMGWEVYWHE